jgi:peptidoglycan/xylan/chitin deacetylase (PgdA/CDA1 family)
MFKDGIKHFVLDAFCAPFANASFSAAALMYHSVNPNAHRQSITPQVFEQQLQFLKQHELTCVLASELLAHLGKTKKLACLTFDDGFIDNFEFAVPLLRKYQIAATFFVPTEFIGRTSILPEFMGMTVADITNVANDPLFEVGSHAVSHRRLSTLAPEEVLQELASSKQRLEEIIGKPVTSFAYPYGDFSPRDAKLVEQAGYQIAFSTVRRSLPAQPPVFEVPRLPIDTFTARHFAQFFKPGVTAYWRTFDAVYMPLKRLLYG